MYDESANSLILPKFVFMKRLLILVISVFCFSFSSDGQSLINDTIRNGALINFSYSYQLPQWDFAERFGAATRIGGGALFKVGDNWLAGVEGSYMFGRNIRADHIADRIVNPDGSIIGKDGFLEDYIYNLSGYMIEAKGGKVLSFGWPNPNSGLLINLGVGFFEHRIAIDVDEDQVPQFNNTMKKGYDRLTNGLVFSEMIGFMFLNPNKLFNIYAGVQFHHGITENRRNWNYNLNRNLDGQRVDALTSFKCGLIIPIYFQKTQEFYYR